MQAQLVMGSLLECCRGLQQCRAGSSCIRVCELGSVLQSVLQCTTLITQLRTARSCTRWCSSTGE